MKKLLALNRGEIATRIFRAATELGFRTVAVYSQEDRLSLHRFKADEAYLIGQGKGPVEAYLDVDAIVGLAVEKGVDVLHPGYGFLSENPALPRACEKAGIIFVGPSAGLLESLGDKTAARKLAQRAGIPVVPGTEEPVDPEAADVEAIAERVGFPLIVKAAHGGGGRGMRVVESPADLRAKLGEASREAGAAFGNAAVFLERYIRRAKHVEIQILGDTHGNILHLYERDCSVQRRHQKVVEIAPAIGLPLRVRAELADAAVRLAREARYYNAGTVEFLVDVATHEWFFIEVNPRVQVEHTVTEMVTGIDIVRSQIQVAQGLELHGEEMSLPRQPDIPLHGTALQCRVTTEDPNNNFFPDYGKIHTYRSPAGFGIRLDAASAYGGAVISPYYDSLLVKVTSWGSNFKQACQRMDRALREFRIRGVKTNIPFLENVVNHPAFQLGEPTTSFLDETSGAVSICAPQGSRDQAAYVSCGSDRERESGSSEAGAAAGDARRADAAFDGERAAARHPSTARYFGPGEVRGMDALAKATSADRHYVSGCASIAAGDARSHVRFASNRRLCFEGAGAVVQPGNVGRRYVRRSHAVSARRPVEAA